MPKLIVVAAFDRGEDGELFAAYGPAEQQHEERAIRTAKSLAANHVGVIAWSREANPAHRRIWSADRPVSGWRSAGHGVKSGCAGQTDRHCGCRAAAERRPAA